MMQSSQTTKPRRIDVSRRTNNVPGPKSQVKSFQKEDKNMNPVSTASPRVAAKASAVVPKTKPTAQARAPLAQSRLSSQKQSLNVSKVTKPKPKGACALAANKAAAAPPLHLPNVLPLDPNCNEPSLPCLCCDGRSPQDNNSMFNHNHNNNNTVSLKQQLKLPPPPPQLIQKHDRMGAKQEAGAPAQVQMEPSSKTVAGQEKNGVDADEGLAVNLDNEEKRNNVEEVRNRSIDGRADAVEESDEEDDDDDDNDDDDDDDDTLVPSSYDCPPSFLDFSLSSSTSSSSTSISSCSDLESDYTDQCTSICSSEDQDNLSEAFGPKDSSFGCQPPARVPPSCPVSQNPFCFPTERAVALCSPDEGYPSALDSPSPEYLGVKDDSDVAKLDLLDFLESVGEFGKMERFSQVIQVARWDLEGEQHWDVLRDRLDHLDHLEKVNREVKLTYIAKLHEKGFDLGELEEQDLSDIMDEMGNIDIPWQLYKSRSGPMGESQEFSDAGVDLTAPSDSDESFLPASISPSPIEPPPRPPKPPARHESVSSELHAYMNICREATAMAVTTSPTLTTFSSNATSPTFTTFRCEKPLPPSPPCIPPLPASKPTPYLSLYTTPSPPPSIPTPTPPIPPPRRRHLARKEAQRLAALQMEQEKTPTSLPPPTSRPPPLPPPPVISIMSLSSPPAIPPPPMVPPPPSFHALDVEIRKLLMLAGLTQAELLKLSPELGVCVQGLEDEEEKEKDLPQFRQARERGTQPNTNQDEWIGTRLVDREGDVDPSAQAKSKDAHKTTTFTEMAKRRKKNTGFTSDQYYRTTFTDTHDTLLKNTDTQTFQYPTDLPQTPPPPPPPRPLPPIPPTVPSTKVSTLPANSQKPERFDWLIAFTPECEAPSRGPVPKTSYPEPPKKSNSSSSSSSGGVPKVTTFKELRYRNKNTSPPTRLITEPEPDPSVITPDPDILYNLKWRKEKAGSDGNQWEYTSQAQALFMQPPPALTSMAALQEMLQRADEEGVQPELCPSPKIDGSVGENKLWGGDEKREEGEVRKEEEQWKQDERKKLETRGQADGGRPFEARSTVSSPPLSLVHPSLPPQPYFLHPAFPPPRSGCSNPPSLADPRPSHHVGKESPNTHPNTLWPPAVSSVWTHRDDSSSLVNSGSDCNYLSDFGTGTSPDLSRVFRQNLPHQSDNGFPTHSGPDFESDSMYPVDSLRPRSSDANTHAAEFVSAPSAGSVCTTPYKNIDVMLTHTHSLNAKERSHADQNCTKARTSKPLPPLPAYYLHHPKNCPLHRGALPRLSPVGALSPPHRRGALPPGAAAGCCLGSPLFPRSVTLPALAAPLYYPNLYPPVPPRAPPMPPKLYQALPQSHVPTVRSVSFGGSAQKLDDPWMGEDVRRLLRGPGLSSQCLQEKKALVSAVGVAVEAILAQFNSSRTVVQKALSGDSSVNPSLGRLVLQCLCPALHRLLIDDLRPHQSDLIAGRRPNSAWALVQATTKPGSKLQALHNLQVRVGELPQLKQSKHRFNAFILGLLNYKLLDVWLSHLLSCSDVLETFYYSTSFMRLSLLACHSLFEELLLVLQPLGLLTFNMDLLFQHHHLDPDNQRPRKPSPSPVEEESHQPPKNQVKVPGDKYIRNSSLSVDWDDGAMSAQTIAKPPNAPVAFEHTSPQLRWVHEKEIGALPLPDVEEDSFAQQAGQVIQQGWGAVLRWGGRLSQNLAELNLVTPKKEELMVELPEIQAGGLYTPVGSSTQVPWGFGRLFGATKSSNSPTGHSAPSRRPSQWLAPGVTALTRMVSSSSAPVLRQSPVLQEQRETTSGKDTDIQPAQIKPRPLRSVRALCDHVGSGSELSFCKGEELVVLGGANQDWIRCRQGDREGLVPIGYTSLIM